MILSRKRNIEPRERILIPIVVDVPQNFLLRGV